MDEEDLFKKLQLSELEYQLLCRKMAENIDFCPLDQKQKEWKCQHHPGCALCKIEYYLDLVYHEIGIWKEEQQLLMKTKQRKLKQPNESKVISINIKK